MPVMDGYETAKYIREQMPEGIANIPILAMTAHAHLAKDKKFAEFGMDDCVLKLLYLMIYFIKLPSICKNKS